MQKYRPSRILFKRLLADVNVDASWSVFMNVTKIMYAQLGRQEHRKKKKKTAVACDKPRSVLSATAEFAFEFALSLYPRASSISAAGHYYDGERARARRYGNAKIFPRERERGTNAKRISES